jgi:hypothetical protein
MPRIKPISRTTPGKSWGCATTIVAACFGLFVVLGVGIGYFLSARPLYRAWQARTWMPTACDVISSRIVDDGETSRPEIVYRYEVGGRQYTANRYNFLPGSNSDSTVPAVVARHSPGTRFECYVDPGDPSRAVINRTPTIWYYAGFPFFIMFAGLPGLVGVATLYSSRRDRAEEQALAHAPGAGDAAPFVLRPSRSPLAKLVITTLVCLICNSGIGLFTYFEYLLFVEGDSIAWVVAAIILGPQIMGVGLLVAVPLQILELASPRPLITLSRGSALLGGSVSFTWELRGAAHRVTRLQITLRGREEATYVKGTYSKTDTHVFFSETIVDASHATSIARGSGTIRIPGDSMHTFTAEHNKVIWTLHLTGVIAWCPDIDENFDITVRPV